MTYTKEDYHKAIEFALNYPPEVRTFHYDMNNDLFVIELLETDGIVHRVKLQGWFIRKCLKWSGKRSWKRDTENKK